MPNDVSTGYNTGRIDLSQAPAADMDWDQLFPNPELQHQSAQPQAGSNGTAPQPELQANQNSPFLKAGDSVYNTAEDAINGVIHKDQEIAKMRNFLKTNGVDPNTLQTTAAQPQVVSQSKPDNQRFFDRIADAATRRDKDGYENAMKDFFNTLVDPWRPTLAEMNRFKAYQQVSRELPGFKDYYENGGYQETLNKNVLFKDMNQIGEQDPNAAQRLPDLYRSAYFYYKGITPSQGQVTSAPQNTPTVRSQPTLQPSALTPPDHSHNTQGWQESNWKGNKNPGNDARKQLIADGDNKFRGMRFEDVNL
jgi:hypothetical protein